jgi:cytochrome c oxidase assembly protein subunit 15
MIRTTQHPWLNRFAWLTVGTTFLLIGLGGLVTSKEAGMAVPDWPTTYGYNMFLFPFHLWTGGIFYEHTHRLVASVVGLLTTILAIWIWVREPRRWLRWMGVAAFFGVVLQGILGGLRVTLFKDQIGIVHATLAQLFLVTVTWTALAASGRATRLFAAARQSTVSRGLTALIVASAALILGQLILGATMRHQHAGLAVPDFPLAYGKLWPPTDAAFVERVNEQRVAVQDYKPITAFQIVLHMTHRLVALAILGLVAGAAWRVRREQGRGTWLGQGTLGWLALILVQASLGAATVWSNKAADVATAHVLLGALSLVWGTVMAASGMAAPVKVLSRVPSASSVARISEASLGHAKASTT